MRCVRTATHGLDLPTASRWISRLQTRTLVSVVGRRCTSLAIPTLRWQTCRTFSHASHISINGDPFEYDTGRWLVNEPLRRAERKRVFDIAGLCHLAAQSVGRNADDVLSLDKIGEGGFNRVFLVTMRDGFKMVARVPYPIATPKYLAVASEAATLSFLRSEAGLPVPEVYGYSPSAENAARTEYIFMEYVEGVNLGDIWFGLEGEDVFSDLFGQLAVLEAKMMSIPFPAGGSLYFASDLANAPGRVPAGIALNDKQRYCVGPDMHHDLWYGRRLMLEVNRGPYEDARAALDTGAQKELAYLEQYAKPLLPFHRSRRYVYNYRKQLPSDHIDLLGRYLDIVPPIISHDPALVRFCIRHPDLRPSNIIVAPSPDTGSYTIKSLIDWQYTSILPLFLQAGIPDEFQNYGDPVSDSGSPPRPPEEFDSMDEREREAEMERYRRRLVHFHYVNSTAKNNKAHYEALTSPGGTPRRRLFHHARDLWLGESVDLKVALMDAAEQWETLTGGTNPCPFAFDPEDVQKTRKLATELDQVDQAMEAWRSLVGVAGPEAWVPAEHYEEAMFRNREMKANALENAQSAGERKELEAHWPFDDMDEENYM
ncbi:protein kinase subdomain-containing protein PKL CAK Fmp29 [Trametes polyzona]|nr:protein kinase subdomain-containing protein PKL CAK Fmp29 [Trametes polyzona]